MDLEIYCITEYIDGYVIKAINKERKDTLNIISVKDDSTNYDCNYEKMVVGKKYCFEVENMLNKMPPIYPPENVAIRIKTTTVWRGGDGIKNFPYFAKNTMGRWIKQSVNVD